MNNKIGYYPILDILLAIRQIYSGERFKPYNSALEEIQLKMDENEKNVINDLGEYTTEWLEAIETFIDFTLTTSSSIEEALLKIKNNPEIISKNAGNYDGINDVGDFLITLCQNYFNNEIAKNNKVLFQSVIDISNKIEEMGTIDYLLSVSDRMTRVDDNTIKFFIKPDHSIRISDLENIIIMPSIFASRNLTFWFNGNNYLFYVSINAKNTLQIDPSDMLLLKTLAFNDKTRLKMLRLLSSKNFNTAEMAEILNVNASTVSRHFKVFKDAGYVEVFSQNGNFINYSLNMNEIENSLNSILAYIKE